MYILNKSKQSIVLRYNESILTMNFTVENFQDNWQKSQEYKRRRVERDGTLKFTRDKYTGPN